MSPNSTHPPAGLLRLLTVLCKNQNHMSVWAMKLMGPCSAASILARWMCFLHMGIQIGLLAGSIWAMTTLVRFFTRVYSNVVTQVVSTIKSLRTYRTAVARIMYSLGIHSKAPFVSNCHVAMSVSQSQNCSSLQYSKTKDT